ncbi:hypothetical protein KM295_01095 [Natronomonas sp. F2-12]|jgi:hypothetical protein|uniref:Uncharacterized protein n=1 Tax=Natronomonas aquatica TaxID=2841590 RepID=A0A9R1CQ99_9EURY|nr:hypothetical protein [Natronomonas aquatica]MCQ4332102.1 hypothetical protein [Natronomonas aquatica]
MNVRRSIDRWMPTTTTDWYRIAGEIRSVLSTPGSLLFALAVAAVSLALFVLPENARLVLDVVVFGNADLATRLRVLSALFPFVGGTVDPATDTLLVLLAGLTGVTVSSIVGRLRQRGIGGEVGTGSLGVLLVTATGGCAACGSVVLAVLGVGAAGTLAILPFGGLEIQVLSMLLLLVSLHRLAAPDQCLVPTGG